MATGSSREKRAHTYSPSPRLRISASVKPIWPEGRSFVIIFHLSLSHGKRQPPPEAAKRPTHAELELGVAGGNCQRKRTAKRLEGVEGPPKRRRRLTLNRTPPPAGQPSKRPPAMLLWLLQLLLLLQPQFGQAGNQIRPEYHDFM